MGAIDEGDGESENKSQPNRGQAQLLELFARGQKDEQGPDKIKLLLHRKRPEVGEESAALEKRTGMKKIKQVKKRDPNLVEKASVEFGFDAFQSQHGQKENQRGQQGEVKIIQWEDA